MAGYGSRGEGPGIGAGFLSGALIAAGAALGGYFIASGLVASAPNEAFVTAQGVAEREVIADLAVWPLSVAASGDDPVLVQDALDAGVASVQAFLEDRGIDSAEVTLGALSVDDRGLEDAAPLERRFVMRQPMTVRTGNVNSVAEARVTLGELVRGGNTSVETAEPAYLYTTLEELRTELLAEAARNARANVERLAAEAGAQASLLRDAEHGALRLTPREPAPGAAETDQIFKRVSMSVTLTFSLAD